MSRPVPHTAHGLTALRAAVAEARQDELRRSIRAALTSRDLLDGGPLPPFAVASTARVGAAGGQGAALPAPAVPDHDAVEHAAPEGETAIAIGLVQRAQAGDAEAFGELYDRYVDQVYRYIAYRVATSQLAEDLTSETFLRALRRIGSFTWQGRDVGAWFVTIARNLIADHYKSGRYRLELTTDDVTESGAAPVMDGPERAVLEAMQNKVLLEAVKQLNAEQQECIVLRFLQGLSVSETAQVMGKNDGAIKALQYRAIRTLGRILPEGVEL
ncbi:MAG: adsA [Frankiales bacterium]|nr:adsA [Frankiales bacterium]